MSATPSGNMPLSVLQLGLAWFTEQPGGLDRYYAGLLAHSKSAGMSARGLVVGSEQVGTQSGGQVLAYARADWPVWRRLRAVRRAASIAVAEGGCQLWVSHFALNAWPAVGVLRHLPHVVHFHGPWAAESRAEGAGRFAVGLKRLIERRVYHNADRLIVLSQAFGDLLCRDYGIDPARVRVIPGGVEVGRFAISESRAEARAKLGWPGDRPIVLAVRRLVSRMGLESLIDAMNLVRAACPDALLVIAGRGRLADALAEQVKRLGLSDHVRLIGFVPDADLPLAYRAADLSVVPSVSLEGFGLIAAESLAAGTPALVTPVGGLPEVVQSLDPALVLRSPEAGDLADGLIQALTGRSKLPSAEACREYALASFSWPDIALKVRRVYEEVV